MAPVAKKKVSPIDKKAGAKAKEGKKDNPAPKKAVITRKTTNRVAKISLHTNASKKVGKTDEEKETDKKKKKKKKRKSEVLKNKQKEKDKTETKLKNKEKKKEEKNGPKKKV